MSPRDESDALLGYARDALSSRGDIRLLSANLLDLEARRARVDAEVNGADAITVPPDLQQKKNDETVARILREEQLIFNAHRDALQSETATLRREQDMLQAEIGSLREKDSSLTRQVEANRKELDQVTSLVSKGLMTLPRQIELDRGTAQLQSDRLDVQLATLRATQEIAKADQGILELKNKRRADALQEATDVRSRLAETKSRLETAQRMLFQVEVRAPGVLTAEASSAASPLYFIVRQVDGKAQTIAAGENDVVLPGDTVKVEPREMPDEGSAEQTAGTVAGAPRSASTF